MPPSHTGRTVEIGQSASDAQNSVVTARRETQSLYRPQQQRAASRFGARDLIKQCSVRFGVGPDASLRREHRVARGLSGTGCGNATSDRRAPLGRRRQRQISGRHGGHVDMKINTV